MPHTYTFTYMYVYACMCFDEGNDLGERKAMN